MNSDMLLYATAELAVLLLCICAFLVFHVGNLKKMIKRLEAKVLELRGTITATKHNARAKIQEVKNNFQEKDHPEENSFEENGVKENNPEIRSQKDKPEKDSFQKIFP